MLKKKNYSNFFYFLLVIFISLIIFYSPSFFGTFENDSLSYINNTNIRLSLYPLLIDFFGKNYNNLLIFQIIFLSFSIVFLVYSIIIFNVNKIIVFLFLLTISLNFYYTSFSKSILTEAIYFSFVNFSIGLFLIRKKIVDSKFIIFLFGICVGGLMAIKPEGLILTSILSFFYVIHERENKKRIIFLISICVFPLIENITFYKLHNERDSVLDKSVIGKIFILSGYTKNNIKNENSDNVIDILSEKSRPIKLYLDDISNPFLKYNLRSDYEVVAQYQLEEMLDYKKDILLNIENNKIDILKDLLKKNPINFLGLSLSNYLAMWMPGGKQIFFDKYKKKNSPTPYPNLLDKSSGQIISINKEILFIVLILFFIMFLIYMHLSILSLYELFILKVEENFNLNVITVLINFHLLVISTVNIASPRYLMPFFPIIIFIILIRLNRIIKV